MFAASALPSPASTGFSPFRRSRAIASASSRVSFFRPTNIILRHRVESSRAQTSRGLRRIGDELRDEAGPLPLQVLKRRPTDKTQTLSCATQRNRYLVTEKHIKKTSAPSKHSGRIRS